MELMTESIASKALAWAVKKAGIDLKFWIEHFIPKNQHIRTKIQRKDSLAQAH